MANLEHNVKQNPQVFVSHTNPDQVAAKAIINGLKSRNVNIWLASDELRPGESWAESIRTAISAISYFLVLLSKDSSPSFWVDEETTKLLKELQSRDIKKLIIFTL
ncbi:MAG: toll/interleukin-1 receptor domain-containing protein [Leptolyngbyaceae cyanobacterium bins.302]|nr:toll/interleukin-1 receptor domain-containing protein [Leptolyngbyaceae cyanobacterium bins.302]